jgi:hypothetical protein
MKENFYFVIEKKKEVSQKDAELKYNTLLTAEERKSTYFLYTRTIPETLELPKLNVWQPIAKLRKGVKYFLVTWHRYSNNGFSPQDKRYTSEDEFFHLLVPESKANPNDGTAEFNRLNYLDIGYNSKKRNTEVEYDKEFLKHWKNKSNVFYDVAVRLLEDLSNLPNILNHWYVVKDKTTLYKCYGYTDQDVEGLEKSDIQTLIDFSKSDWTIPQALEHVRRGVEERKNRPEPVKLNISDETRKRVQSIWKNLTTDENGKRKEGMEWLDQK